MVGCGHLAVRRRLTALGQGLMGGGVAILYLSLYASFTLYHLVPQGAAFGGMVLVTAGGLALGVGHDAVALSFLALLGGLLTPVLLSTGTDARDALFAYLLLLDVGTLGIALFKQWRGLDAAAFVGTVVLYGGWFDQFYTPAALGPGVRVAGGLLPGLPPASVRPSSAPGHAHRRGAVRHGARQRHLRPLVRLPHALADAAAQPGLPLPGHGRLLHGAGLADAQARAGGQEGAPRVRRAGGLLPDSVRPAVPEAGRHHHDLGGGGIRPALPGLPVPGSGLCGPSPSWCCWSRWAGCC